jgi:hypothetical protein
MKYAASVSHLGNIGHGFVRHFRCFRFSDGWLWRATPTSTMIVVPRVAKNSRLAGAFYLFNCH